MTPLEPESAPADPSTAAVPTRLPASPTHASPAAALVGPSTATAAVRNTHAWFEVNSGWAPPDDDTLADWLADGVCRCPDECLVAPEEWCQHGLASWWLVLQAL